MHLVFVIIATNIDLYLFSKNISPT